MCGVGEAAIGIAGQTYLGFGIHFTDGGQSLEAGVGELGVAALSVVQPSRAEQLNRLQGSVQLFARW